MTGAGKRILVVYSWPKIWSMGPGRGSPDFYLSLKSLASVSERVVVVHPAGPEALAGAPEGVEAAGFRSLIAERLVPTPACLREGRLLGLKKCLRAGLFALNWLIRLASYCSFTVAAYRAGTRAAEKLGPSLVAAYGCTAVPAARLLASRYRLPLVVRLFGVSLGMREFSLLEQAVKFDETLSFKLRADSWIITDDGSAGDEAARRLGVPGSRVVFPLCGVDRPAPAEEFDRGAYRRRLGLGENTRVVLRVSRLWHQQRVDRLIRHLPHKLADGTPVAAVVAGEGPERASLERLAAGLGARVVFTGPLDHCQLTEHYRCADLYAATGDRTNLSNSVLEALCHGLPVVALAAGRTERIVEHGVNGLLLPPERPESLTGAIEGLLADEGLRRRLCLGALHTAEEKIPDFEQRMAMEAAAFSLERDT